MEHFSQQEWVDLARGVLDADRTSAVEEHLATNCTACRQSASLWKSIASLASQVRETNPPADAVAVVKEALLVAKAPKADPWLVQFAELLFDSRRAAAPVGVRSHVTGPRHSMHRSGDCQIELQVEATSEVGRVSLTGQVVDAQDPSSGLGGTRVTVMRKGFVAAKTVANAFGEFTLDCGKEGVLWILIEAPERLPVAIRMPEIAE